MSQRRCAILATKAGDDIRQALRKRDPPPPGPPTVHAGGVIVYSPVLPHGFAARLAPGPVDATTAARAAFSVSCLRSAGPICRNVLGPLAHTLGRYFAGGGCVSIVTRTGVPHDHQSLNAILVWRRPAARPGEGERAARRWLASCALAQADSTRWHPRRFVPCDAALDLVYFYLAEAVAPASLLRSTCSEMCAWLARSDAVLTRLTWALTYAETHDALCPINVDRLEAAFDALRRRSTRPQRNPRRLQRQRQQEHGATCDSGNEVECDIETAGCGCPSPYACTAWGPERSVGAWQRSALNRISFVAATPAHAADPANSQLGHCQIVAYNGDVPVRHAHHGGVASDSVAACAGSKDYARDGQQPERPMSDAVPTAIAPCPYSIPVNVKVCRTLCLDGATTAWDGPDNVGHIALDDGRQNKRCRTSADDRADGQVDEHIDDDGPPAGAADLDSPSEGDGIDSDAFWQWINQQFSTEIDALF